jgi:hypothetical protein
VYLKELPYYHLLCRYIKSLGINTPNENNIISDGIKERINDISIGGLFIWAKTFEGQTYWSYIDNSIKSGTILKDFLEKKYKVYSPQLNFSFEEKNVT